MIGSGEDARGGASAGKTGRETKEHGERSGSRASYVVPEELNGRPLDGVLRALASISWNDARAWIETGKVRCAGELMRDGRRKVRAGARIDVDQAAPRPHVKQRMMVEKNLVVFADQSLVVVDKPAGISTVPFDDAEAETVTLDVLVREVLSKRDRIRGRAPLGVVQRLDKMTSGVLVFARSMAAKKHLAQQLRVRSMHRKYLAIVHGVMSAPATIESYLVENRGDRLRGSARHGQREGQLAVTHVTPLEILKGATLVACKLETGRTHQIRIHMSERGHPLVGEAVYIRDFRGEPIPAPRLMLHAAELGFEHPDDGREMRFESKLPEDFEETLARLR